MSFSDNKESVRDFFSRFPVFRLEEFVDFLEARGSSNEHTRKSILHYHLGAGNIVRIRRGLYASLSPGIESKEQPIDPFLVASRAVSDAVISHHAALQFYGIAYSIFRRYTYHTESRIRPFSFQGAQFVPCLLPKALRESNSTQSGVQEHSYLGLRIRVTSYERTLVDVLASPEHGGGWEEIWRSLEAAEFFDLDRVIEHALALKNATVVARVGFYLDQHKEQLSVGDHHLRILAGHAPRREHYLERSARKPGRLIKPWNLVVPEYVLTRAWEEPHA